MREEVMANMKVNYNVECSRFYLHTHRDKLYFFFYPPLPLGMPLLLFLMLFQVLLTL